MRKARGFLREKKEDLHEQKKGIYTRKKRTYTGKLFKSKFDACKVNLKTTFKIVSQLLTKANCSKFPNHTNEKTLANSFKKFLHK